MKQSTQGSAQQPQAQPARASLMGPADAFARMEPDQAAEATAYLLGLQAVIWGMQWVKANRGTHDVVAPLPSGATPSPVDPRPHGVNVWGHARALLTDRMRLIETPNTETLYSVATIDLGDGPVVIVHPDLGERYFRTSIWELHGDAHTISQKQDGGHPSPYVLLPLGWDGDVPADVKTIRVRSRYVQAVPHVGVYGPEDVANVTALQQGFQLIALRDWGASNEPLDPGPPMRPLHRAQTATPPGLLFFEELCETLKDLTIRADETAFARQLEAVGITLKAGFDVEHLAPATVAGLTRAVLDAQSLIEHKARALSPVQPGGTWEVSPDLASLDDWLFRAAVGWKHIWGDSPTELVFPMLRNDAQGHPLHGNSQYALRFPPGELPPARYWRITMYDLAGFLVANPIDRFGVGNMAETPQPDNDGGLTIRVQHQTPDTGSQTNWLPAPAEGFFLMMRLYQPEARMDRGDYTIPPLQRTN